MAQVWSHQGRREEAKQALTQARMIWDEWNEPCEIELAQVHFGQGLILVEELEFYKAEDEIRKACEIVEQGAGEQSPALGIFLAGLSEVHRVTGRDRQSQEAAQKSQELLRPKR
jgi:tetratricopeptide (TPR) repeat protein